ncbi:M16 family metallopeptidase [Sulfidibacter corallicola]|uniref:Insulinase family protein n=1 Tax=Sulfidibacter corallicola TaxID=2818388 RepID=A0A8A4TM56_SULCO|nr:pitrilysin family protein [Sulfidibacter corallicola]QTD51046.1 insulinase family protein [Sulfidibacter corallicola]
MAASKGKQGDKNANRVFPYNYHVKDLENGLRIVVVPTGIPNLVSLQIPVQTGSRNEVEPGKSGFAHFFEHMMFRGTEKYPNEEYSAILKNIGADQNAYTTDDYTNYHLTFSKEDLEIVLELEADRFQNLKYSLADFQTEARAVLGEYNKNYANPILKLIESQRNLAFQKHTYKHTTMGFIQDIEDMPNQYDYSLEFFKRFYRPEKTVVMLTGDVEPKQAFALVEKYWGDWERGSYTSDIPKEPEPRGPLYEKVDWDSPTLPWVTVAFHGPAVSETELDMAAMDIVSAIAFSSSSDIYQKLVIQEQKVTRVMGFFPNRIDPYLLTTAAQLKNPKDAWYVRDEIQKTFARMRTELVDEKRLEEIKSNLKYDFVMGLTSSERIAAAMVGYLAFNRDPETLNRMYRLYDQVTPQLLQKMANKYFVDQRMVVVNLSHGDLPEGETGAGSVDRWATREKAPVPEIASTFVQSPSPILNFRILFNTGSVSDPSGKPGLATLTSAMITQGGSNQMSFSEIQKALYPMAASFGAQVDKEMTVFIGATHADNLEAYYDIVSTQLLDPAWSEKDFERVKTQIINSIKVNLRGNNDEELGKEALYEFIYEGHPYGTLTAGHIGAIEKITLEDIKAFYAEHYTRANLVLGFSGNFAPEFIDDVKRDFATLPAGSVEKRAELPKPADIDGLKVRILEKETRATAISFGFPIEVNRAHPDFAALWLARSYFGEHRSSNSYLYQRIREIRGMNYGDYAYIEYFPRGMFQFQPDPNLARQQQIFQVWIRPVPPQQAHFALRVAKYELDKFVKEGISKEDFEATRNYLLKYVNVLTNSDSRRLGYQLDSEYYDIPGFNEYIVDNLKKLTRKQVNKAIKKHLQSKDVKFVFVTKDAAGLRDQLIADAPSPMTYNAEKPADLLKEDKVIEKYPLKLKADDVTIIPIDKVFD